MRGLLGALVVAAVGCAGIVESEDVEAPEAEPARPEPTVARIADGDRPSPPVAAPPAKPRSGCSEGFVLGSSGECTACSSDDQCRGACNLDTGRCSADGWCTHASDCVGSEACDGGFCVARDDGNGPCGIGAIHFAWDSDTVSPGAKARLFAAADCFASLDGQVFIEAHADLLGSEEFNIMLSERRGQAVKDLLVAHRVRTEKLQVIAKGSLESTGTDAIARAKDRRVVFVTVLPVVP